ncbi:MAG: hypothetical protein ACYSWO_22520 [Planctomycetota bacterium]|jgi:hypothetical protein
MPQKTWAEYGPKVLGSSKGGSLPGLVKFLQSQGTASVDSVVEYYRGSDAVPDDFSDDQVITALESQLMILDRFGGIDWNTESNQITWIG